MTNPFLKFAVTPDEKDEEENPFEKFTATVEESPFAKYSTTEPNAFDKFKAGFAEAAQAAIDPAQFAPVVRGARQLAAGALDVASIPSQAIEAVGDSSPARSGRRWRSSVLRALLACRAWLRTWESP